MGTVEYRSMTEAVRSANPMIGDFIEGSATDIDINKRIVTVQLENLRGDDDQGTRTVEKIKYDKLVVAVGCQVQDRIVPGAAEHCLRLKTCEDARKLRVAIGECLEYASRPDVADGPDLSEKERELRRRERSRRVTFCIVGGGPTGVELAGELSDFIKDCTKPRQGSYRRLRKDIKVVLVQGGRDLVPAFDQDLRDHALKTLRDEGIDVRLQTRVQKVGQGYIELSEKGSKNNVTVERLDTGFTVWAAGTCPVPFIDKLLRELPVEAREASTGRVLVDRWLRCPTKDPADFGSIFVLGDAAAYARGTRSALLLSLLLPQTAQVAGQQGAYLARLFNRDYNLTATPPILTTTRATSANSRTGWNLSNLWLQSRGLEEAPGFEFLNLGLLAYLGNKQALSQVQLGDSFPIASYAGSASFVLWRSVYLVKQVATRNRLLILFDWMKSNVFGRDITRL